MSRLLLDANVIIDYKNSRTETLALISRHLGPVVALRETIDEVHDLTCSGCASLGIEVIDATDKWLREAAIPEPGVSFQDRLCMITCRDNDWICVTNDTNLQRLCKQHGVQTRYGLRLLIDLADISEISSSTALDIALKIQTTNPLHINDKVMTRFRNAMGDR